MEFDTTTTSCEHPHTPSTRTNLFIRFLEFFLFPKKVYFHHDDTGLCSVCKATIGAPYAYYHWGVKVSYAAIGMLASIIWAIFILPLQLPIVILGAYYAVVFVLYDRLLSAIIFTFSPWEICDERSYNAERQWDIAKKERTKKFHAMLWSAIVVEILLLVVIS